MVQRHREICAPIGGRPFSDLPLRGPVDDGDAVDIGHVDEDLIAIRIDLEALVMRLHRNVTTLAAGRRIDNSQPPPPFSETPPNRRRPNANLTPLPPHPISP